MRRRRRTEPRERERQQQQEWRQQQAPPACAVRAVRGGLVAASHVCRVRVAGVLAAGAAMLHGGRFISDCAADRERIEVAQRSASPNLCDAIFDIHTCRSPSGASSPL